MENPFSRIRLALALAAAVVCAGAKAAELPVRLAIDASHPGAEIGPEFSGLSYEVATTLPTEEGAHYFSPDNAPLVGLFHTLGVRSLRVGGNSSDRNVRRLPSRADLDQLFGFAGAAGIKVMYCLRLHDGDPKEDAATARYLMDRYGPLVDYFSIGQEPSAYPVGKKETRPPGGRMGVSVEKFPYATFRDEWREFARAVIAAEPAVRLCGPSVHNNPDWMRRFIADFGRGYNVALVTGHLYPGGAAGKVPSPAVGRDWMLSDRFVRVQQALYDGFAPQARAAGLPYRLEEVNSYYNGGAWGSSNTFASALWGLDFMYWWASHGAAGLNFHTGDRVSAGDGVQMSRYAVFSSVPGGFEAHPLAYGIKAFDLGGHGRLLPVAFDRPGGLNLTAYAVLSDGGGMDVTVINKEHGAGARGAVTTLSVGAGFSRARAMYLRSEGGDVAATSGVTLGGGAIDRAGRWSGTWTELPAAGAEGTVAVTVPAACAVVIHLAGAQR